MISEFSCPGGAREPISPTQLMGAPRARRAAMMTCTLPSLGAIVSRPA